MNDTLTISPTEHVTVRTSTAELLELEATYLPSRHRPPKHWHPSQDEHFEVLEGSVEVRVDGVQRTLAAGERIDIPSGAVHQFGNPGPAPARVRWQIRPGGRTEHWFRGIDTLHRQGRVGRDGTPSILAFAVLLAEYRDVFRLSTPAAPVVRAVLAALAVLGRLRGYRSTPAPDRGADRPQD
ncbi:MAG: cupin domain-containing protein [Labedaea sp.]